MPTAGALRLGLLLADMRKAAGPPEQSGGKRLLVQRLLSCRRRHPLLIDVLFVGPDIPIVRGADRYGWDPHRHVYRSLAMARLAEVSAAPSHFVHARPGRRWCYLLLCRSATTYRSGRVNPGIPTSDPPLRGGRHAELACRAGRWLSGGRHVRAAAGPHEIPTDADSRRFDEGKRGLTTDDDVRLPFTNGDVEVLVSICCTAAPANLLSNPRWYGQASDGRGGQSCSDTMSKQASRTTTAPAHGVGPGPSGPAAGPENGRMLN